LDGCVKNFSGPHAHVRPADSCPLIAPPFLFDLDVALPFSLVLGGFGSGLAFRTAHITSLNLCE
jgi:hypothetical protein